MKWLVSSGVGILLGVGLVAWLQPNAGGATLVVVVAIIIANLVGQLTTFLTTRSRADGGKAKVGKLGK